MDHLKILTLDIETAPAVVHSWGLYNQNHGINQVVEPGRVICFAAKWKHQKGVKFFSEYDEGGPEAMALAAHRLLDEADLLVTYNGVSFDVKWLHSLMIDHQLTPPSKHRDVDLLKIVKKNFRFLSNKLQFVADSLGVGSKLQTGGHELWVGWMNGDPAAIRKMTKYCKQDVRLTEDLFSTFYDLNWVPASVLPATMLTDEAIELIGTVCPWCGSEDLAEIGANYTAVSKFRRWKCRDCKRTSQSRKNSLPATELKGT